MIGKMIGRVSNLFLIALFIAGANYEIGQTWNGLEIRLWVLLFGALIGLEVWSLRRPDVTRDIQNVYSNVFNGLMLALVLYAILHVVSPVLAALIVAPLYIYWFIHNQLALLLSQNCQFAAVDRYFTVMRRWLPRDITVVSQQAADAMSRFQYERAVEYAKEAIALNPTLPTRETYQSMFGGGIFKKPYDVLMTCYIQMGDGPNALANARICFGLHDDKDFSDIHRGIAFMLVKDFDAAVADLEHGLNMTTVPRRKVIAEVNLGLIEYALENDDAALEHWSRALDIQLPPYETRLYTTEYYVFMGLIAFHRGDTLKAWHMYRTALKLNPHSVEARAGMAVIHASEDRWDLALKIWHNLQAEYAYFADPEDVIRRHFRWTPPMAEGAHQIVARINAPLVADTLHAEEQRQSRLMAAR
jgi:tetratricopeptide (TPR) repeat protein